MHGSSFAKDETRYMGAAVITSSRIIWAQTRYESLEDRTDQSAFTTTHVHIGSVDKEGFLPPGERTLKTKQNKTNLSPPRGYVASLMSCYPLLPGHQR